MAEEGIYNVVTTICISGVTSCILLIVHMVIFHGMFSFLCAGFGGLFLAGAIFSSYLKRKRFGNRNYSLGERVKKLELMMGEHA